MASEHLPYLSAAIAAFSLLLTAVCLFVVLGQRGALGRLANGLGGESQSSMAVRLDSLATRVREDGDRLQRQLLELDQGLRKEVATGTTTGLATAFERVQEGNRVQAEELARFGKQLQEGVGEVGKRVEAFAEKLNGALETTRNQISTRLAESELAAAQSRADLLRDVTAAVDRARELIDAALKSFGEEQGRRLEGVEAATRGGGEAVAKGLSEFREEVVQRLEAVKQEASDTLGKAEEALKKIGETMTTAQAKVELTLAEQREIVLSRIGEGQNAVSEKLTKDLSDLNDRVRVGFDGFGNTLREEQERLRTQVGGKLDEMRAGNETKLEQMRQAVDEQLQSALEKRMGESFQRVAEQFAQVQQAIGHVQNAADQVGDLKRLFANVKARGGWGEAQIQSLLEDMLPPGSFEMNKMLKDGTGEAVEFALRMPLKGAETDVWLPIDAKFPTEDYDRLLLAGEAGDREAELSARKAVDRRIRDEAKRIASKYIVPPLTVEFAVMYLPTEGLFSEVSRSPGLVEAVWRESRVMILSPSLLPAMVNCIQVGHMQLVLERNAASIGETLGAVKAEWDKLGKSLDALAKRAETLTNGIRDTQVRARAVGRKLRSVNAIEYERAESLLGLTDSGSLIEAEVDAQEEVEQVAAE